MNAKDKRIIELETEVTLLREQLDYERGQRVTQPVWVAPRVDPHIAKSPSIADWPIARPNNWSSGGVACVDDGKVYM